MGDFLDRFFQRAGTIGAIILSCGKLTPGFITRDMAFAFRDWEAPFDTLSLLRMLFLVPYTIALLLKSV